MSETLKQRMEVRNQKLIDAVIARFERDLPGVLAMVGVCGSFCNGDFHERSDLDLMILIENDTGWQAAECCVIGEVGFDFYCTTWESLENDAKCETPHLAKLLDTKIVYCKKPEAMARYLALREKARAVLEAPFSAEDLARAEKEYEKTEPFFARLMRAEDLFTGRVAAANLLYHLENALCMLNKTYFKQSTRRMFDEFAAMHFVPADFSVLVHAVTDSKTLSDLQNAAKALMLAADESFKAAGDTLEKPEKEKPTADNIRGCLEEMISNFRGKMYNAAESGDSHAAFSALASLQSFFDDLYAGLDMPRYDAFAGYDPADLTASIEGYESALRAFSAEYEKAGLPLNRYDTVEEFTAQYLQK